MLDSRVAWRIEWCNRYFYNYLSLSRLESLRQLKCHGTCVYILSLSRLESLRQLKCHGTCVYILSLSRLESLRKLKCHGTCAYILSLPRLESLRQLKCHGTCVYISAGVPSIKMADWKETRIEIPTGSTDILRPPIRYSPGKREKVEELYISRRCYSITCWK